MTEPEPEHEPEHEPATNHPTDMEQTHINESILEIPPTQSETISEKTFKIKKKKKLVIVEPSTIKPNNINNRGTGAGGSNTNKNGLPYEEFTDLDNRITTQESGKITFDDNKRHFIRTKQSNLFKCMKDEVDTNINKAHGCKNPDECYIDSESKTMFIIEKKFQQCSGSVCEKIQTPDFKSWQYSRTFPKYNVVYIYCLSDWFKENCEAELEYLVYKGVPFFWGNSKTYKDDIIDFILNYK